METLMQLEMRLNELSDNTEEFSRINVNKARTIANRAKETAAEFLANKQREVYR